MFIGTAPCRVSFVGGGTDLPEYTANNDGAVIGCTIQRPLVVMVRDRYGRDNQLITSFGAETASNIENIRNEFVREAICRIVGEDVKGMQVVVSGAYNAEGMGLGTSSALTVALVGALTSYSYKSIWEDIPELAFEIERRIQNIGRQDMYFSYHGGPARFDFSGDEVAINKLNVFTMSHFWDWLLFFKLSSSGDTKNIMQDMQTCMPDKTEAYEAIYDLVDDFHEALSDADFERCGRIIGRNWKYKQSYAPSVCDTKAAKVIDFVRNMGGEGGKLLGSGGGGMVLNIVEPSKKDRITEEVLNEFPNVTPMPLAPYFTGLEQFSL